MLLLGVLLWAPWQALHGAPLMELSGDQDFQLFLQRNLEFTRKIRGDVAALQRVVVSPTSCGGGMAGAVRSQIRRLSSSLPLSARQGQEPAGSPALPKAQPRGVGAPTGAT